MSGYGQKPNKYFCKYCNIWIQNNLICKKNHENSEKHKNCVSRYTTKKSEQKLHNELQEQQNQNLINMLNRKAYFAGKEDQKYFNTDNNTSQTSGYPTNNTNYSNMYSYSQMYTNSTMNSMSGTDALQNGTVDPNLYSYYNNPSMYSSTMAASSLPIQAQTGTPKYMPNTILTNTKATNTKATNKNESTNTNTSFSNSYNNTYSYSPNYNYNDYYNYYNNMNMAYNTTTPVLNGSQQISTTATLSTNSADISSTLSKSIETTKENSNTVTSNSSEQTKTDNSIAINKPKTEVKEEDDFFGGWSTVSVKTLDNNYYKNIENKYEEALMENDVHNKEEKRKQDKLNGHKTGKDTVDDDDDQEDDALATYNPYGGDYKGIDLSNKKSTYSAALLNLKEDQQDELLNSVTSINDDKKVDFHLSLSSTKKIDSMSIHDADEDINDTKNFETKQDTDNKNKIEYQQQKIFTNKKNTYKKRNYRRKEEDDN